MAVKSIFPKCKVCETNHMGVYNQQHLMPNVSAWKRSKTHFNHRIHDPGVMQKPLAAKAVAGGEGLRVICFASSL